MSHLKISHFTKSIIGVIALTSLITGCAEMSQTQRGTATGAGIGAGLGAVIGGTTGDGGGKRAAGGAVLGGAAGALIGNIGSTRMQNQKHAMEQATQGTGVVVSQTTDNRLKLEIPSDISFDTNRSNITANFRSVLDRFAATLNENPATTVTIIGHTDNTGSDTVNNPLSVERAANTRDYLSAHGVASNRISVSGKGSYEPIASNNDSAGRSRNRRVEIYVAESQR